MTEMEAIFDEIHEFIRNRDRREGEFTISEYAEHHGVKRSWASVELRRVEEAGVITSRKARVNGHICLLYKKTGTVES